MTNDGPEMRFKGVRKRKWGKYVAEIRSGKRSRISLGSYFTPEAAARAYDAALLCLRGPHASSFNFPDSKFNSTALDVVDALTDPSPDVIRTGAIAVGSEFDTVPARRHPNMVAGSSEDRKASTHFGQGVDDQQIADRVEEEEDVCDINDAKYLLQSPEEISYEERVQMSLLLPEEISFEEIQMSLLLPEEEEVMQSFDSSEIIPDLTTFDETTFLEAPAKPPT
ncbi:hypothetical protein SUGI_0297390 [Cryptomeria japonica]|uniref:ethylene-responsive transcription factor ERF010-like n=1 Tax=Cryptomeria japonica TaxID=3369 RepID=UPI002408E29E|nr:ethylene-responsive transcription factor ERF010-like [Cryptomeria japonica]GLJ17176.1 hypothetical protein SUGI_0297390 [Cryptomeria japonica]